MKYRVVLFDFDGTLSPSLDYWFNSFRVALGKLGIVASDAEIVEKCFYKNDDAIARGFGLKSCGEFWRHTSEALQKEFSGAQLFGGVDDVLGVCQEKGVAVGLVTSGERGVVVPALERLGVHHHFQVVVTADDITHFKPHPEPVLKAVEVLKADVKETLFVGDHAVDVLAGKAAGTDTAVFFTESHSRFHKLDELKACEPTFVFSDYRELLELLTVG